MNIARLYGVKYMQAINEKLAAGASVHASVAMVRAETADMKTLRWGDYQPIVLKTSWPDGGDGAVWLMHSKNARDSLASQPNFQCLSFVDSNVPKDKAALLDAAIQKCFNTTLAGSLTPGIPIYTVVQARDAKDPSSHHDVHISWMYDKNFSFETMLLYTMICPFKSNATSLGQSRAADLRL